MKTMTDILELGEEGHKGPGLPKTNQQVGVARGTLVVTVLLGIV